mmetsp:Transcript_19248/g.40368  ORF Transcript_19248/g.40368 Transcript_19248/m.40368 type:complete len:262 (-) Transcript_19248:41-826(-)
MPAGGAGHDLRGLFPAVLAGLQFRQHVRGDPRGTSVAIGLPANGSGGTRAAHPVRRGERLLDTGRRPRGGGRRGCGEQHAHGGVRVRVGHGVRGRPKAHLRRVPAGPAGDQARRGQNHRNPRAGGRGLSLHLGVLPKEIRRRSKHDRNGTRTRTRNRPPPLHRERSGSSECPGCRCGRFGPGWSTFWSDGFWAPKREAGWNNTSWGDGSVRCSWTAPPPARFCCWSTTTTISGNGTPSFEGCRPWCCRRDFRPTRTGDSRR